VGQPAPIAGGLAGGIGAAGGIVGKWFGSAISEATAFAAGIAIGPVLGPPVQALQNATWTAYPDKPVPVGVLAEGVAQGQITLDQAHVWARSQGIGDTQFGAMVDAANVGPGSGYAFELWRRGAIDEAGFRRALLRLGIEQEWIDDLVKIHDTLLSSQELANLQQQGFIDSARANQEGGLQGVTPERQQLRFEAAGLPPGIETGLEMLRRGIIDVATFDQIVREGHTKTKYTPELEQLQDKVLTHNEYVEARVRGYIDNAALYAGGKLTGYTQPDLDLLHKTHGRPPSWHQVWIGIQRGGKILDPVANLTPASTGIDPVFFAALQQSNIQQQWYDIVWHLRWNYPAAFVLRTLATSGDLTQAETEQILLYEGWEPTLAAKVAAKWAGGTGTTATQKKQTLAHLTAEYLSGALSEAALTNVLTTSLGYTAQQAADEIALANFNAAKTARTKATKNLEKRFVGVQLSETAARAGLAGIGWPAGAIDQFISAWDVERADTLTTLTVGEIEKALKAGALLASQATPLLQDLGEDAAAIATIIATSGANPAT